MSQYSSPAGLGLLSVGASPQPSGWAWSRRRGAEPDDHRCGYEQARVQEHLMVLRVLVARAELFQTRAVTRWEDGEEDGRPGRRSSTLNSHLVGSDGGTDHAETDHARRALRNVSTGGCS